MPERWVWGCFVARVRGPQVATAARDRRVRGWDAGSMDQPVSVLLRAVNEVLDNLRSEV